MITIVASEFDPHADAVICALEEKGFSEVFRVDLESAHSSCDYATRLSQGRATFTARSRQNGIQLETSDLVTIYWRRVHSGLGQDAWLIPTNDNLDRAEAYWSVRWTLEALSGSKFPFGHPASMHTAGNKVRQLHVAFASGFRVPCSLCSNSPAEIIAFCRNFPKVVVKPLRSLVTMSDEGDKSGTVDHHLWARVIESHRLESKLQKTESTALFCQEYIAKIADVRLNVLPDTSVACRIDGSKLASDVIDWRPTTFEHKHEIIEVPDHIERACREYLKQMNLKWGAFDFGLTADGEWVFFECNPNGQWLWIQLQTGFPLAQEFARTLLAHHESHSPRICHATSVVAD